MARTIMHFLFSADDPLGRPDKHSLPQQALMEVLISEMSEENQRIFKDENGNFLEVEKWEDVEMNGDGSVQRINWWDGYEEDVKPDNQGRILLEWLPDSVEVFETGNRAFEGDLNFRKLPRKLREFFVRNNRPRGSVDFTRLPPSMTHLNADENDLTGEVNLSNLPLTIELLSLSKNNFSGKLDIKASIDGSKA